MNTKLLIAGLLTGIVSHLPNNALAASDFNEILVFGDSLLDSGNLGVKATNLNSDGSNTYAPLGVEILAEDQGFTLTPALAGGNNYAVIGATSAEIFESVAGTGIGPGTGWLPGGAPVPPRASYLAEFGSINNNALVVLDGGANDLINFFLDPNTALMDEASLATAIGAVVTEATTNYVETIAALDAMGAGYIMVSNMPDLGATPALQMFDLTTPGSSILGSTIQSALNTTVESVLPSTLPNANIIPFDMAGLFTYMVDNAESLGVASGNMDISAAFSAPPGSIVFDQRYMCYDATLAAPSDLCIEHPIYGKNGVAPDPSKLLYNDAVHPSEIASELMGSYMIDIFQAPKIIGILPDIGLSAARTQVTTDRSLLRGSRWGQAEGELFVSGNYSSNKQEWQADSSQGNVVDRNQSLTIARTLVHDDLVYGLSFTTGKQKLKQHGSKIESDSLGLSGLIGYRHDKLFIDASISYMDLDFNDIDRQFNLGYHALTASGDTSGDVWSFDALIGYDLLSSNTWHLAPAIGYTSMEASIDSFTESGGEFSNYHWGSQDRDSRQWQFGIVGEGQLYDNINLYFDVFSVDEQEDSAESITITNTNLSFNSYHLPSYTPGDDDFIKGSVGVQWDVTASSAFDITYEYSDRGDNSEQVLLTYSVKI